MSEKQAHSEKKVVQVFGGTNWLLLQQLALATMLAGGRVGVLAIPDLVAPPPGTRPN